MKIICKRLLLPLEAFCIRNLLILAMRMLHLACYKNLYGSSYFLTTIALWSVKTYMNIFSNIHKNKTSFYLCLWWLKPVLKICKILHYYEQQTSLGVFRTQSDIRNGVFFAKKRLLADNYFCKKALWYIFDWVLNTTLYAHFILRNFSRSQNCFLHKPEWNWLTNLLPFASARSFHQCVGHYYFKCSIK